MSFLGRALPFVLLAVAAGCSAQPAEEGAAATESNLDQADTTPADGPLTPDATFGTNGAVTLTGPSAAISAAKRADGSIGVLGNKGSAASLTHSEVRSLPCSPAPSPWTVIRARPVM